MKKYRKLACILAGSMTMSLFAGCIGNGDVVPEEKNESTDTEEPTASETSQEIKKAESRDIDHSHSLSVKVQPPDICLLPSLHNHRQNNY